MSAACQVACVRPHMRRQDSGSSRAAVGRLRHGRTWKRELRRLWTPSIVIKRSFPRGVSSWALSHSVIKSNQNNHIFAPGLHRAATIHDASVQGSPIQYLARRQRALQRTFAAHTARDTLGRSIRATIGNVGGEPQCTQGVLMRHGLPSQVELKAQWLRVRRRWTSPWGSCTSPQRQRRRSPLRPWRGTAYMSLISETVGL
jgi:hypothetical protein